ncbi:MAG: ATP-binding protein [Thermoplasmatota archaeon]
MAAVERIAGALAAATDERAILDGVTQNLIQLIPASCQFIALWDRDRDIVRFPYYHEKGRRERPSDRVFANGLTEYVLRTGRPLHIARRFDATCRELGIEFRGTPSKSWLGAPLIVDGQSVGIVAVYDNEREQAFGHDAERTLRILAAHAAASLKSASLHAARDRAAKETAGMVEALQRQAAFDEALLQAQSSAGEGLIVFDPANARVVFANRAVEEMTGFTAEELRARTFPSGRPEQAAANERIRRRAAGEAVPERFEFEGRRKDGAKIFIEVAVAPLESPEGPRTVAIFRDVTMRKEAESQLQRQSALLETLVEERTRDLAQAKLDLEVVFENTIDGFLFVDKSRNLVSANRRFAEFFHLAMSDILHGDKEAVRNAARAMYKDPSIFDQAMAAYDPSHLDRALETTIELVDGRVLQEHSAPIYVEGEYVGRVWTYHDITQRKQLEDRLREYNRSLEIEVERRTQSLLQSAKMAALGQLVAGVAHEINNPLAFVKSNTALLREEWEDLRNEAPVKSFLEGTTSPGEFLAWLQGSTHGTFLRNDLERILDMNLRGLTRISDIVHQLRTVASATPARVEPTDLATIVHDSCALLRAQFGARLSIDEDAGAPCIVEGDSGQLTQVVTNLLVNAAEAIQGNGTVGVRLLHDQRDAILVVRDTGVGMADETVRRMFDPFFTTKERGTGLGLAITYSIVKEHGGEINVDSKVGQGTRITVRLPFGQGKGGATRGD